MRKCKLSMEEIAKAVVCTASDKEAAALLKCSHDTIYKRRKSPEFQAAYRKALCETMEEATAELKKSMLSAARILRQIAEDSSVAPQIRLNACQCIIQSAIKLTDAVDDEQRLRAYEQRHAGGADV